MALARACLGCGRLARGASRCPSCQRDRERAKTAQRPEFKSAAETRRRREAVADHRARHGDWCPGYHEPPGRPAHPAADLTADHAGMVGLGGDERGPLVVRCRSCNSARAAAIMNREFGFPHGATAATPRQPDARSDSVGQGVADGDGPVVA